MAELKLELKLRGLPVSGTKTDLIERLKPYQESSAFIPNTRKHSVSKTQICSTSMEVSSTTTCLSPETQSSTPPVSPVSSEIHNREDVMEGQSETHCQSSGGSGQPSAIPEEQDRRLHEKERQIEELLKKLEQEQKLVEKLKMQLKVEKRSTQSSVSTESINSSVGHAASLVTVKPESPVIPSCTLTSHGSPSLVKLEKSHAASVTATPLPQFFISHQGVSQVIGQPQTLLTTQHAGTQILLPVSLPNNATTIQLTNSNVKLQVL